jgi:MYXO-CTERM domain-containing protein
VVGAARSDVWNSLWSHWWVAQGLAEGHWPIATLLLNHPDGGRLLVADPLGALLATPATLLLGPVLALNFSAWLHLTAAGLAAHALGRRLGGRGWIAGLALACSPLLTAHLHNGSSEAFAVLWLPLAGLAVLSALRRGGASRVGLAGLVLALATAASWYTGLATWLLASCLILLGCGDGSSLGSRLRRGLPALGLALLICGPLAIHSWNLALAPDGLVSIKTAEELHRIRRTIGPADPRIFLHPGPFRSPDFATLEGSPGDYVALAYLGWVLLGLAALPLLRRRRPAAAPEGSPTRALLTVLVVGVLAAMGPVLVWGGMPLELAGRALPLPWRLIEDLPGFAGLSLLWRLALAPVLALGLLADRAAARLPPWVAAFAAALVLSEALLLSPAVGLPAVSPVPRSPALEALASAPPGAVLNLPVAADRSYLYEQVVHRHPLAAGLNSGANRGALELLATLRLRREGRLDDAAVLDAARQRGIRYVVIHRGQLVAETFLPALGALRDRGEPMAQDEAVEIRALW